MAVIELDRDTIAILDQNIAPSVQPNREVGTKRRYHHGDLKRALLTAAEEILAQHGSDGLTMRDLSKRVGVSRTAAYHHFRDRADLLAALATDGINELLRLAQEVVDDTSCTPHQRLEGLMLTYVRYAADHPEKYKLMMSNDGWQKAADTALQQLARNAFRQYVGWITQFSEAGLFYTSDPLRTAQLTWATLHGMSRMLMDGIISRHSDLEEIVRYGIKIYTRKP